VVTGNCDAQFWTDVPDYTVPCLARCKFPAVIPVQTRKHACICTSLAPLLRWLTVSSTEILHNLMHLFVEFALNMQLVLRFLHVLGKLADLSMEPTRLLLPLFAPPLSLLHTHPVTTTGPRMFMLVSYYTR
jgi:hypothetical protein